jgi:hypothetical protein
MHARFVSCALDIGGIAMPAAGASTIGDVVLG